MIAKLIENRGTKPRTAYLNRREKHGCVEDVEWRNAVYKRDDYTCQDCQIKGKRLNAHHIKGFKDYPELRFDLDNGITLCVDCHKKTDNYGWAKVWNKRRQIAEKRIQAERDKYALFPEDL